MLPSRVNLYIKKEGCATTDNMFRMAFHARKYIPLIQIIVKLALRLSLTAIGSTEETILLANSNMMFLSSWKRKDRWINLGKVQQDPCLPHLFSFHNGQTAAGFPFVISTTTAMLFFPEPGNLTAVGNRADCRALVARPTSPVDRPRQLRMPRGAEA